ncbi:MAG: hypothetical protein R6V75_11685, partial [Bacteroidales bacterium]
MKQILASLLPGERRAFALHLLYSLIEGIILGVLALNEYVLIKSLKGTDFQIGVLFQFSVIVLLFAVVLNEWIRRSRDKTRLIRIVAWVTRVPLVLLLFFPRSVESFGDNHFFSLAFLGIFLMFYLANPIIYPIINLFLKSSYRHHLFGSLYSYATGLNKAAMLLATFIFGIWLDANPYVFVYVYPVLALLGISSIYILSRIPHEA